ncbi:T9SS type A sorting domain-containing protein [bacterium]|nr:T9SS type A sorting domain-containing protein [bacterium]
MTSESYVAGRHAIEWTVAELPSGVYLLRLETDGQALTKRVVISR